MLHTLQSHILLAQYFFSTGNPLYAELHSSNAVAIALRCGLHKIRSANPPSPSAAVGLVNEQPTSFEYASDPVEEGERIQVFWYCFNLHKTITVATQHEDQLCGTLESYSSRIDTPWPEEMVSYEQEDVSTRTMGSRTIDNFLPHNPSILTTGTSLVALLAKASFLFHRTAYVASKHSMSMCSRAPPPPWLHGITPDIFFSPQTTITPTTSLTGTASTTSSTPFAARYPNFPSRPPTSPSPDWLSSYTLSSNLPPLTSKNRSSNRPCHLVNHVLRPRRRSCSTAKWHCRTLQGYRYHSTRLWDTCG